MTNTNTSAARRIRWNETLAALTEPASGMGAPRAQIFPHAVHRILMYGPPGTGKSSALVFLECALGAQFKQALRITLHQQMAPEDLFGCYMLRDGSTIWVDGPAVIAMRRGLPLILDEITEHSGEVRCALHAIMDDLSMARITLATGETIKPEPGFCIVGTTNNTPADLPEALADRFDIKLPAMMPAPGILDAMPEASANMLRSMYAAHETSGAWNYIPPVTVRSMQAFHKLEAQWDSERAARAVFLDGADDFLTAHATNVAGS